MPEKQAVDLPCPVCSQLGEVGMITHIDEIPYFGEHVQVTLLCDGCGWRQSDFIPAEGKKPGAHAILVQKEEHLRARVVRSSSCTIRIPELDLEVNPGSSASGYVTNIEGVFNRFIEVVEMVYRQVIEEDTNAAAEVAEMLVVLNAIKNSSFERPMTLEFLDPHGHSQIFHEDSIERELTESEIEILPVGPDPAVFSND